MTEERIAPLEEISEKLENLCANHDSKVLAVAFLVHSVVLFRGLQAAKMMTKDEISAIIDNALQNVLVPQEEIPKLVTINSLVGIRH